MRKDETPRKRTKPARRKKAARTPTTVEAGVPERPRPALDRWVRLLRSAVGALLDVADAAAGVITKGRGHRGAH